MYEGLYINLDRSAERRESFERMLAGAGASERYRRFPATDGSAAAQSIKASVTPGALGCWMSHLAVLRLPHTDHLHIVEDDVAFPNGIVNMIDQTIDLAGNATNHQWDIIFTEVIVSYDIHTFQKFWHSYAQYQRDGTISLLSLKGINHWGLSSYIVNKNSIAKLAAILDQGPALPEDHIRRAIESGKLNAIVVVPFLTTLSSHADVSEIITPEHQAATNAVTLFRRAFYLQADQAALLAEAKKLTGGVQVPLLTEIYAQIMRFVFSEASDAMRR